MQKPWLVLVGLMVLAALLGSFSKKRRSRADPLKEHWPLEPKPHLLTERERVLFQRLRDALPDHIVLAQVQLIQLLAFERGRWKQAHFNRICQLSVDFVVVRRDTSIVAAIELDDASHDRSDRREADARKTHALNSAGIQLVRWQARALPDLQAIASALIHRP
jgi:LPXTG-motif cell wall-anchored protein